MVMAAMQGAERIMAKAGDQTSAVWQRQVLLVGLVVFWALQGGLRLHADDPPKTLDVLETMKVHDRTIWANEVAAQDYEKGFIVPMWDRLLRAQDPFAILGDLPLEQLILGSPTPPQTDELGVREQRFGEPARKLDRGTLQSLLDQFKSDGYRIVHTDWHQAEFLPASDGPARSTITFKIHAAHPQRQQRIRISGKLRITWAAGDSKPYRYHPQVVDATGIRIEQRTGPPVFVNRLTIDPQKLVRPALPMDQRQNANQYNTAAVSVYDLNRDGLPEILLAGANDLFWNRGDFKFEHEPLVPQAKWPFTAVIVADFTGDGRPDLFGARQSMNDKGTELYELDADGRFSGPPRPLTEAALVLRSPMCIAAADVDGDGDLDVFIGQWQAYFKRVPANYWDADDAASNHLLLNDGTGRFKVATYAAGLGAKRGRRTYSASFIDLDDDNDQDLMVISDFAGIDVYLNDGTGKFTDVTEQMVDMANNFGMGHTIADYNNDGRLDFYVTGMSSSTARRLEKLQLVRSEFSEHNRMRRIMGFGSRLYLGGESGFAQPEYKDQVARTGWCWGTTSFDFDNDSDQDIYVTNGNRSGKSTQDYCTTFWCHDIYNAQEYNAEQAEKLYQSNYIVPEISWDGYQSNCLLVNRSGEGFTERGYLLDVGFTFDSRTTISADFDDDGRVDLLVSQSGKPGVLARNKADLKYRLYLVMQNNSARARQHNWIGIKLGDDDPVHSPMGARITVIYPGGRQSGLVVTGDSFASQHPNTKHFGLGKRKSIDAIEVRWPNGKVRRIENPAVNRYHTIRPE